jgi:hypothetical protein
MTSSMWVLSFLSVYTLTLPSAPPVSWLGMHGALCGAGNLWASWVLHHFTGGILTTCLSLGSS